MNGMDNFRELKKKICRTIFSLPLQEKGHYLYTAIFTEQLKEKLQIAIPSPQSHGTISLHHLQPWMRLLVKQNTLKVF